MGRRYLLTAKGLSASRALALLAVKHTAAASLLSLAIYLDGLPDLVRYACCLV